jgi:hypothetical protein
MGERTELCGTPGFMSICVDISFNFMNTKLKLLNCNANLYFNKKCLSENIIPKFAIIKTKINPLNKIKNKKP